MNEAKFTPGPNLLEGLTDKQLDLHPGCDRCGWRKGGLDSWDGNRCKCGEYAPSFRQLFTAAREADAAISKATGESA
jgi:hypothetical protein